MYKNHFRQSYRNRYPKKFLYTLLNDENIIPFWVCLARFEAQVNGIVVVFAEAMLTCILGTLDTVDYRSNRSLELPSIDWRKGANRSSPLVYEDGIGGEMSRKKHRKTYSKVKYEDSTFKFSSYKSR